jgi:hypothetical protein
MLYVYFRGAQPFTDRGATFTLSYRLVGRNVINENNLLKRFGRKESVTKLGLLLQTSSQ